MKVGDFVEVDYVGRIKDSGQVFDLTKEDIAKKEDVYNPKASYGSVVLIVGADFIIKGLNEALQKMKIGEEKKVEIPPEKAFGEKKEELVRFIPLARFKEQNLDPVPGVIVNIGIMKGTIVTVSGGRVQVDFNHPLAGKTLEYDIKINSEVAETDKKVKAVAEYFTGVKDIDVSIKDKEAEIKIKKKVDVARPVKSMVADAVIKWCGIEKVKFLEVFEKAKKEEDKTFKRGVAEK
jgi:FKBP-type peptidyl-prolyl cis-trans isomerase SlyD